MQVKVGFPEGQKLFFCELWGENMLILDPQSFCAGPNCCLLSSKACRDCPARQNALFMKFAPQNSRYLSNWSFRQLKDTSFRGRVLNDEKYRKKFVLHQALFAFFLGNESLGKKLEIVSTDGNDSGVPEPSLKNRGFHNLEAKNLNFTKRWKKPWLISVFANCVKQDIKLYGVLRPNITSSEVARSGNWTKLVKFLLFSLW